MLVNHSRISIIIADYLNQKEEPAEVEHSKSDAMTEYCEDKVFRDLKDEHALDQRNMAYNKSEVPEAEATHSLSDRVLMHKNTNNSAPSEESDISIILAKTSNYPPLTCVPGVEDRFVEPTSDEQARLRKKPLPPLPREVSIRAR